MPTYIVARCYYCRRGGLNFYDSGGQISSQTLRTKGFLRFETPDKLPNATHIVISVILEAIIERQKAPRAYVYSGFGDFRSSRVSQTLRTERFRRFRRPKRPPNVAHIVISAILEALESPKRYVQSDFGDSGGPRDAQTLRI